MVSNYNSGKSKRVQAKDEGRNVKVAFLDLIEHGLMEHGLIEHGWMEHG
jgi:hypothetical protein